MTDTCRSGLFASLLLLTLLAPVASGEDGDSLWERAVQIVDRSGDVLPGLLNATIEGLDPDGERRCTATLAWRLVQQDVGVVRGEPVPEDGEPDGSGTCGEEVWDNGGTVQFPFVGDLPFASRNQDRVQVSRTGEEREVAGRICIVYGFRWTITQTKRERVAGEACLDAVTASPLEMHYSPVKLNRHIVHQQTTLRFVSDGPFGFRFAEGDVEIRENGLKGRDGWARLHVVASDFWRADSEGR